ncbi:MAG: hypothetical protein QXY88_02890 [Candidatus Bathyarchaeia archaeon]
MSVVNVKSYLIALLLSALVLTFAFTPLSGSQVIRQYDPWADINDDGKIDARDITYLVINFGTSGTPINKTQLLLEILAKIEALEARVNALEANYSVTNIKLAPYAIPFNSTYSHSYAEVGSTWYDMPDMKITINISRPSCLLILFSAQIWHTTWDINIPMYVYVRALVDNIPALPYWVAITPYTSPELAWPANHRHALLLGARSFNFYSQSVSEGVHTVAIQWCTSDGLGAVAYRTLIVIALPV